MPGTLAKSISPAEAVTLALACVLAGLLVAIAYRAWVRSRVTPEELERRRRARLVASGKMGDANLAELRDDLVFYSYAVRGVVYTACQDVSSLRELMPADLSFGLGPVSVRYDPRNPANSIVLAEAWCGLRASEPRS